MYGNQFKTVIVRLQDDQLYRQIWQCPSIRSVNADLNYPARALMAKKLIKKI